MALDTDEIRVALTGHVYRGDPGTAFPASITDPVDETDWDELGYTTDDGVTFTLDVTTKDIPGWQSRNPLRILQTATPTALKWVLQQLNHANALVAFRGGTHSGSDDEYEYHPAPPDEVAENAYIVEWSDGDLDYRIFVYRSALTDKVEIPLKATDSVQLPINVGFLAPGAAYANEDNPAETWYLQHNDPALGEPAEGST